MKWRALAELAASAPCGTATRAGERRAGHADHQTPQRNKRTNPQRNSTKSTTHTPAWLVWWRVRDPRFVGLCFGWVVGRLCVDGGPRGRGVFSAGSRVVCLLVAGPRASAGGAVKWGGLSSGVWGECRPQNLQNQFPSYYVATYRTSPKLLRSDRRCNDGLPGVLDGVANEGSQEEK